MRSKPDVPMQKDASLHRDDQEWCEPIGAVRQKFADVGDVKTRGIAGRHDVGHVHVARWAPGDHDAAAVLLRAVIEAGNRTSRHVACSSRLMIVRRAATIRRTTDRAHVIADPLQKHDRKPDHFGVPKHVASEPKSDAARPYSHLASSSSVSCRRANALMRGKYVGSCLIGS